MDTLPTPYQQYIHISRYSRYRHELGRRETWPETVSRYFEFFEERFRRKGCWNRVSPHFDEVKEMVLNLHVLPSMRALMTAGEALDRENIAGYNCSYVPLQDIKAFAETLYILMCGTGVGFSVERQIIASIPEVPLKMVRNRDRVIMVEDSKKGWAEAFHELLISMIHGEVIPSFDVSKVRPAGSPLRTFGGRASGPGPLLDLFEFTIDVFKKARGRRLTSIECHDIATMIGSVVVVGGVRRSAMISLSNLSDERMRRAKSGNWWVDEPQRALANNSVAYTERPEVGHFMTEWLSLYESKSGERGIFNRDAARRKIERQGLRDPNIEYGTNPCAEIVLRPFELCNLSEIVVRPDDSVEDLIKKAQAATILGTWQASLTDFQFVRPQWSKNCQEEALLGVSMTGIVTNTSLRSESVLRTLRGAVIEANHLQAGLIGINSSAAMTTVKPSGTASQLVGTPSGIHPEHAPFYIRRVRGDVKDPLVQYMIDQGYPHEPDVTKPESVMVFSFPMAAPEGSITREDMTAIQHLKLVHHFYKNWSDHAVSCTISVREPEWPQVGGWVWEHFDELGGVSFLPYSEHTYRQAPYEEISEAEYLELKAKMPTKMDILELAKYEGSEDRTLGAQTLACTSGVCEVADLLPN